MEIFTAHHESPVLEKLHGNVCWEPGDTQESFDQKVDTYVEERMAAANAGEAVWVARNFDADHGRVYDYFREGRYVGYVMHEYEYGISVRGYDPVVRKVTLEADSEPGSELTLEQAVGILEVYGAN